MYRSGSSWKKKRGPAVWVVDRSLLNEGSEECLVNVAAWAKIGEANKAMRKMGYAFTNLGSAVLQTYAGVISTSTHGSGLRMPPLCDDVRSILLLKADGSLWRIEPYNGITNETIYKQRFPHIKLEQNDELFYAVLVSMGCMGVVLEYIACGRKQYKLKEVRIRTTWKEVKERLITEPLLAENRHVDIIMNPYRKKGNNTCILTIRNIVPDETARTGEMQRFIRWIVVLLQKQIGRLLRNVPELIDDFLEFSLSRLPTEKPYVDDSTEIFDLDLINKVISVSAEYCFPIKDNAYMAAIDSLIQLVEENKKRGLYHNTPFGIRFVAPSKAYLSMMQGEAMCTVETALLSGTHGWRAMLRSYEELCLRCNGRPHWGQYHELTGRHGWFQQRYPFAKDWLRVLKQMDPKGVFQNQFTRRMGF
jgi:FAD/FMN-containing dehydrogenase